MTTALNAIAFKARTHPQHRFQNLSGLMNSSLLQAAWSTLNKHSAPGIDGVTATQFKPKLMQHFQRLTHALKSQRYRANKIKRVYIPKSNGKERPLGLPTLDNKLVQQSAAMILEHIWEQDFCRFSYGYRPNKSAHQAIQSLQMNVSDQSSSLSDLRCVKIMIFKATPRGARCQPSLAR